MADIAEDDREKGFADDKCPVPNGTGWTVDVDVNGVSSIRSNQGLFLIFC